tara:strand:+ start:144 stop:377 length:234 start_codon:yes stop_codon:yes gene_type:complete
MEEKIKAIIAETFNLDYEEVQNSTGPENVQKWDSFGQMTLVLAIEKEFKIVLEYEEIFKINSTGTLIELVEEKLNAI